MCHMCIDLLHTLHCSMTTVSCIYALFLLYIVLLSCAAEIVAHCCWSSPRSSWLFQVVLGITAPLLLQLATLHHGASKAQRPIVGEMFAVRYDVWVLIQYVCNLLTFSTSFEIIYTYILYLLYIITCHQHLHIHFYIVAISSSTFNRWDVLIINFTPWFFRCVSPIMRLASLTKPGGFHLHFVFKGEGSDAAPRKRGRSTERGWFLPIGRGVIKK